MTLAVEHVGKLTLLRVKSGITKNIYVHCGQKKTAPKHVKITL